MKKILALMLAAIMLLSMAACGGKEAEKEPDVPATEAPEKPTEPPVTEPPVTLTMHENVFFTVGYMLNKSVTSADEHATLCIRDSIGHVLKQIKVD